MRVPGVCRKLGRAMLRPIHDQKTRRDGQVAPELQRALEWWVEVLTGGLCERRAWKAEQSQPVHLFCDASGRPAHLGAVLFIDGRCCFTDYKPPEELVNKFRRRRDNQIMGLELLSISLGFCTFEQLIEGRNVVVHSDNTGSEVRTAFAIPKQCAVAHFPLQAAIRRGTAVSLDHAQLVHTQWTQAAEQGLSLHILRVGTHDNIADLPSRGVGAVACVRGAHRVARALWQELRLLQAAGAEQFEPVLEKAYWNERTWEVLHERWRL
jgi:hypothetical protein